MESAMETDRNANWGVLAVVIAAVFAGLTYLIVGAGPPPSLRFGVAEGVLMICVAVMIVDMILKTIRSE
jgi:hypothetical protein